MKLDIFNHKTESITAININYHLEIAIQLQLSFMVE